MSLILMAWVCYTCGNPTTDGGGLAPPPIDPPVTGPMAIRPISGNNQAASIGTTLPAPLVVRAFDSVGNPFPGFAISWNVANGGSLPSTETVTDSTGTAEARWVLGDTAGNQRASATSSVGTVDFSALATAIFDSLVLSPRAASIPVGGTQQFQAATFFTGGVSHPAITFSATGGTVTTQGLYTAGASAGTFQVIASANGGFRADTSSVTITQAGNPLTSLTVSPSSATVLAGANQTFTVSGKLLDGTTVTPAVNWSAAGGSINSAGVFTAGPTAGTFQVQATATDGSRNASANVTVVGTSSGPGSVFYTNWGTAVGTSTDALTDGGHWDDAIGPHNNIAVVNGAVAPGAPTTNIYRVTNSVLDLGYNWVEKGNLWVNPKVGETRYWRVYLYNATADNQGSLGPEASYHPLEFASPVYNGMEQWNLILSTNSNGTFPFKFAPLAASFPKSRWIPTKAAGVQAYPSKFTWYRIEWSLTRTAPSVFTMHARISKRDAATGTETVAWDDNSIRDASLNQSLATSGSGITGVNDGAVGQIRIGTNGGSVWSALTSDQYIYWAAVCVRSDTWCGPYVAGEH